MGMKNTTRGEIVKVEGGHIVRSTGRKDRHSKVYTAKGPRDRRVRLSAHTAIQFYDVQDRLGYDRPSKAVDWLIDKARTAIDKLAELPPLDLLDENEINTTTTTATTEPTKMTLSDDPEDMSLHGFHTNSMSFGNYTSGRQDLCLSLESFQGHGNKNHSASDALFSTSAPMEFDPDMGSFQRMVPWNGVGDFNSAFVSHREPLQSSYLQSVRAWDDLQNGSPQHHKTPEFNLFSLSCDRYGSQGFSGFCIPSRNHGDEQHNVDINSPNSH